LRHRVTALLITFVSANNLACVTIAESQSKIERLANSPVPFVLNSGFKTKQLIVVSNEQEWQRVWSQLHSKRRPRPIVPTVNFDERMVIVYALGIQRTGGYSVRISGVESLDDQLQVNMIVTRPAANCVVTAGLTSPADIILLPSSNKSVAIVETEIVTEC
jgi:hypothetical protein